MTSETNLQELLSILRRRRRLIGASVAVGACVALLGSLTIPRQYTAKAQIVFEPRDDPGRASPLAGGAEEAVFQTHITALTSRAFVKPVFEALSRDPAFREGAAAVRRRGSDRLATQRLDNFLNQLNVHQERDSHVIAVTFRSTVPTRAALAANRLAQLYIASEEERKREQASRDLAWLNRQLPQVRAGFERAEPGREAAVDAQVYERLLERREQLRTQQQMAVADLRVLSLASPPDRPNSPSPLLFIVPVLFIIGVGSSFLAVILERLDPCIRSADDVDAALGLPCIGLVPLDYDDSLLHERLLNAPFGAYAAAIRSVFAAIEPAVPCKTPKVVFVSSSLPNEGRTTLAVSLAAYATFIGRQALLLSVDLRPPASPHGGGGGANEPRLALYIDERPPGGAVVRHNPDLRIDHLSVCVSPGEALRAASGGEVAGLLGQLRESYDYIIIDGPPLLTVAEARLLASMADTVLLAVRWGRTHRNVAQDALRLLRSASPEKDEDRLRACVVLTQVDLREHVRSRYGGWESLREIYFLAPRTVDHRPTTRAENPAVATIADWVSSWASSARSVARGLSHTSSLVARTRSRRMSLLDSLSLLFKWIGARSTRVGPLNWRPLNWRR